MDSVKLLRRTAVLGQTGFGKSTLYALIAAGKFPQPVKIGRASAWRSDDLQRWIDSLPKSGEERASHTNRTCTGDAAR